MQSDRPVTPAEKKLHDRIAQIGCIACLQDGHHNTWVSIHHVHGRRIEDCHMHVLALCHGHHQGDNSPTLAVHVNKARWEARYGDQDDLVAKQWADLGVPYTPRGEHVRTKSSHTVTKGLKPIRPPKPPKPKQPPKPSMPKADKPKQKIPKPAPTPAQQALIAERKQQQKAASAAYNAANKAVMDERKAKYLEDNQESIQAYKDKAKERNKAYRKEQKEKAKKLKKTG